MNPNTGDVYYGRGLDAARERGEELVELAPAAARRILQGYEAFNREQRRRELALARQHPNKLHKARPARKRNRKGERR